MGAPLTLPPDFFDQKEKRTLPNAQGGEAPETLPADFFTTRGVPPTLAQRYPKTAKTLGAAGQALLGAGKGLVHTLFAPEETGPRDVSYALGKGIQVPPMMPEEREAFRAHGPAQKFGYGAEQAAEFLVPGGAEERLGVKAAELLPRLGRFARPAARLGAGALTTGAINKAQGGDFGIGAVVGAGGGLLGEGLRAAAPSLAESALGITRRLRGFGKTPGEALLAETSGKTAATVAEQAQAKINQLTSELEAHAGKSAIPTTTASAVAVVDREMSKAAQRNSKAYYDQLNGIREQLTKDLFTGQPLSGQLPASKLVDLKRGIGELEKSWNPDLRGAMKGIVRKVYHALDEELDRAVPASKGLNQRISSLIPVAQRAESTERGAELTQRLAHRFGVHTGALTSAAAGGILGYREGGLPRAAEYGLAGLVLPELLASPTAQLTAARTLGRGRMLGRAARGAVLSGSRNLEQ